MGHQKYKCHHVIVRYILGAAPLFILIAGAHAENLTAGAVVEIMSAKEFAAYAQGIVEGLAQARYENDNGDTAGMQCIYEWLYETGDESHLAIRAGFEKYPDHSPGAVMSGLIQKECPR